MTEFKKHTDKIATSILRGEYADYDKNWWHYDREYNMLLKAQTEAFKLANEAAEQQDKEAIDTVLSHINTVNKKGLDDRLQEKSIEQPDNQEGLSNKKDMELPSDEQIEQYALENILDGVGIQSMINTKAWIAGARWMRGLIQERRKK